MANEAEMLTAPLAVPPPSATGRSKRSRVVICPAGRGTTSITFKDHSNAPPMGGPSNPHPEGADSLLHVSQSLYLNEVSI
jgi:hypothetical protein